MNNNQLYPSWVEKYSTGKINMNTQETSKFKKDQYEYTQAISSVRTILTEGNNSSVKLPIISNQKQIPKTEVLDEQFTCYIPTRKNNTIFWVLIIFLIMIWIIYFIAK